MVASRRSAVMRTSGTVIMWPSSTGSCTSPRVSISASAWRINSPTRNWRWDALDWPCPRGMTRLAMSDLSGPRQRQEAHRLSRIAEAFPRDDEARRAGHKKDDVSLGLLDPGDSLPGRKQLDVDHGLLHALVVSHQAGFSQCRRQLPERRPELGRPQDVDVQIEQDRDRNADAQTEPGLA